MLTELEKNKIRDGNNRRKQRQRERENNMKRKIDEEKEEASGSSSSSGSKKVVSNDLYEKWRGKYYRDTKLLKVKVSDLTRKNFSQNIDEPSESASDGSNDGSSIDSDEENPMTSTKCRNNSLSKSIWHVLSPKTKRKTKLSLSMNSDPGLNIQLRKELGINLINEVHNNEVPQSNLSLLVETFLLQEHITKLCPDKKKDHHHPKYRGNIEQLRFRMGSLWSLHEQMLTQYEGTDRSLSSFQRNVPLNICKPKENEWGTCLCIYCVNPPN